MIMTKELIMTLLITFGVGKISELQSPKYYDLITEDGKIHNIMIHKKFAYACPVHCGSDHYHRTLIVDSKVQNDYIFYSLHGLGTDELSINSYSVIDIEKIDKKRKPQKIKNVNVQTYLP